MQNQSNSTSHPIVIIADSLGLPRDEPELVQALDTYPALLNKKYGRVINCAYGYSSSKHVLWQARYFKGQTVSGSYVFHFGIVDCTPRVLSSLESYVLNFIKVRLPDGLARFIRNHRLIRKVSPSQFQSNCEAIKDLELGKIIIIPIAPASAGFELLAPGVQKSVNEYNAILKTVFQESYCSVNFDVTVDISADYHHLTSAGHKRVFDSISMQIDTNSLEAE
jgi:hypothetical protein